MRIIDTSVEMLNAFSSQQFDLAKWEAYADRLLPGLKPQCLADMNECIKGGFSWETDFLPVLNAVFIEHRKRVRTISIFHKITDHLDDQIISSFGKSIDADIVLYLGLCNGAGWVTKINGVLTILMGIEKIMELNWNDPLRMKSLILHELGHAYQAQYGVLERQFSSSQDEFLWQLFTEGIAMAFEQMVMKDPDYYHQDRNGWAGWCKAHLRVIANSFQADLQTMTRGNQRYFGDWVSFHGHPDTGYFLGTQFVKYLSDDHELDEMINWDMDSVREGFAQFCASLGE